MLILLAKSGQLGNQLTSLSAAITIGLEYGHDVYCPIVDPKLKEYFNFEFEEKQNIRVKCSYHKYLEFLLRCIGWVKRKINKHEKSEFKPNYPNFLPQFMMNWIMFRRENTLVSQYVQVKQYLGFKEEINKRCINTIQQIKLKDDLLVAVHFRRSDYKFWREGKWYYEDEEFLFWMRNLYNENNNIHFLIFTNDKIEKRTFDNEGFQVTIMKGSVIDDLCCMSLCDYVMGPPSTFSWWASYIGNSNLLWLKDRKSRYTFSDFENICESIVNRSQSWTLD